MTIVSASGYESEVSAAAVLMLATCAAFQTATGTNTPTLAKAFIGEDDAGEASTNCLGTTLATTGNWAIVRLGPTRRPLRAFQTWGREGEVTLYLHQALTAGDDAASIVRRMRNLQATIATQLEALFGTANCLTSGVCDCGEVTIDDETGSMRNRCTAPITITWTDLP